MRLDGAGGVLQIILAKETTICSCEYRNCEYLFGGEPYGATNRVRGVPTYVAGYTTRTEDDRPEYESLSAGESERE